MKEFKDMTFDEFISYAMWRVSDGLFMGGFSGMKKAIHVVISLYGSTWLPAHQDKNSDEKKES